MLQMMMLRSISRQLERKMIIREIDIKMIARYRGIDRQKYRQINKIAAKIWDETESLLLLWLKNKLNE